MKVKELIEKMSKFDGDAEIITYNRTSRRWLKTDNAENYPIESVGEMKNKCCDYAKKQLESFKDNDVTFFF